jgi:NifU-like protein involved in Fe-S cluster formation
MSTPLYTTEILRLATSTAAFARLEYPDASAEKRSPICGSRVTVDVAVDDLGCVSKVGMEVRACALGQASSALMAQQAIGKTATELEEARDHFAAYLSGARDDPGDWPGLDIFAPAREKSARHPAIMLPFEAIAEAARKATA